MTNETTSKHLGTSTELTVLMPIKKGFIQTLNTVSYATRLRIVLKTLNQIRKTAVEQSYVKAYTDPIERLRTINDFRWCIVDNDTKLLLAVTFDSAWETYIRKIADDAGPLLDVILCNCEGYETYSSDLGYQKFAQWARKHQLTTDFYYSATGDLTVDDMQYLTQLELAQRDHPQPGDFDVAAARLHLRDIVETARDTAERHEDEARRQALGTLLAMHNLTKYFPDDGGKDHLFLHKATYAILEHFESKKLIQGELREYYQDKLQWFEREPMPRVTHPGPKTQPEKRVQGDLLTPYPEMTHSCLLLMRILKPGAAASFLKNLAVSGEGDDAAIKLNIAFTYQGLKTLQVPAEELAVFPKDFQEGMAARAGLLGDILTNHPEQWQLPTLNWPPGQASGTPIELSTIDFVIQLQTRAEGAPGDHKLIEGHPLLDKVRELADVQGIQLLAVEPLRRHLDAHRNIRGHFGFRDGFSQPQPGTSWKPSEKPRDRHKMAMGELLLGYGNNRTDDPTPSCALFDHGSFLVMRKLNQDAAAFENFLQQADQQGIERRTLKAKMMGRDEDGTPLIPLASKNPPLNDFDYSKDPDGDICPLHSHIRRTNPRTMPAKGKTPEPRIVRRGFSYGPAVDTESDDERGLVFMAYNASISEQFEIVQRWVSGANSTGVASAQHDPFLGVPREGQPRTLRFYDQEQKKVLRFDLGDKPWVTLRWGMYLFVPALDVIKKLAGYAAAEPQDAEQELIERGREIIGKLQFYPLTLVKDKGLQGAVEDSKNAWKRILEDLSAKLSKTTLAVWAAVLKDHDGVLRTPYGVLVADEKLVMELFHNHKGYSVREYWHRMDRSLGQGYLGMDPEPQAITGDTSNEAIEFDRRYRASVPAGRYAAEAEHANPLIYRVSWEDAFAMAEEKTTHCLETLVQSSPDKSNVFVSMETLVADVFAGLTRAWFGIPQSDDVAQGRRVIENMIAAASYIFPPHPTAFVQQEAGRRGGEIADMAKQYVKAGRRDKSLRDQAIVSGPLFAKIDDDERLARTIGGITQGFVAPTRGSFLSVMLLLIETEQLWRLQQTVQLKLGPHMDSKECAGKFIRPLLVQLMRASPAPDMVHRTAVRGVRLGDFEIKAGERVVLGIVGSALQRSQSTAVLFGGDYDGSKQAPVHSCPGQPMAMGVLLGMVSAIVQTGTWKPWPTPLTLRLSKK